MDNKTIKISWDDWCKDWISWEVYLLKQGYIFTKEDVKILKELDIRKDYVSIERYYNENLNKYPISKN